MNILIINPPIRLDDKPRHIPHGLAILANIIKKKLQIHPIFLDINAHRYTEGQVKGIIQDTDFGIVLIGGLAPVYKAIIELSEFIRSKNSEAKIIVGGYVAMPIPDILLKNSEVDIVCTGEGEITIVELLQKFQKEGLNTKLTNILGISYKENHGGTIIHNPLRPFIRNLDSESMLPAYELLPMEVYLSNPCVGIGRDIDMMTMRGCPYHCTFCYQPWGHKPRSHSVDFIINAIKYLKEQFNVNYISFLDDEFMVGKKKIWEFCERRNRLFPNLLWSCTGRADIVARNEGLVKSMRKSGCVLIAFGFESGSRRMLQGMRKMQTIEEMEKTVQICRRHGLPVPASFIIGMPGENNKSCQETIDFCFRNKLSLDSLMFATPYPGTGIFDLALRRGRINENRLHEFMMEIGDARDFRINLTDCFSDEELIAKREAMMQVTRKNYENSITKRTIEAKMEDLFGDLVNKTRLDERDREHRIKHGGFSIF